MTEQFIYTHDDVLRMLDALLDSRGSAWWGEFFADRAASTTCRRTGGRTT